VAKRCANARACAREAIGGVRGLEEGVAAPKQELAHRRRAWQHGEARERQCVVEDAGRDSTRLRGRRHGRGVTRGIAGSRRWRWRRCDGERR
jgi:hypothetical protein